MPKHGPVNRWPVICLALMMKRYRKVGIGCIATFIRVTPIFRQCFIRSNGIAAMFVDFTYSPDYNV